MALTPRARRRLIVGLASSKAGNAIADALDAATIQAPSMALIGPPAAAVRSDTLANCAADTEARLRIIENKFDTLITALKTAGMMVKP